MAIRALSLDDTIRYVSKRDPDKDRPDGAPTYWLIGVLDSELITRLEDEATHFEISSSERNDPAGAQLRLSFRDYEVVRYGLKGWEHFCDAEGNPIPFRADTSSQYGKSRLVVARDLLQRIPAQLIKELASVIVEQNHVSPPERKN